jgi:hypothetical protein
MHAGIPTFQICYVSISVSWSDNATLEFTVVVFEIDPTYSPFVDVQHVPVRYSLFPGMTKIYWGFLLRRLKRLCEAFAVG